MIHYLCENIVMPDLEQTRVQNWIRQVAAEYGFAIGDITYIFCNDERILEVNRQFLGHDYYTDIITFDYSTPSRIAGDIYISLDTVGSNAEQLGIAFEEELKRILIHGVLHLTGQEDKTEEAHQEMTRKENLALGEY